MSPFVIIAPPSDLMFASVAFGLAYLKVQVFDPLSVSKVSLSCVPVAMCHISLLFYAAESVETSVRSTETGILEMQGSNAPTIASALSLSIVSLLTAPIDMETVFWLPCESVPLSSLTVTLTFFNAVLAIIEFPFRKFVIEVIVAYSAIFFYITRPPTLPPRFRAAAVSHPPPAIRSIRCAFGVCFGCEEKKGGGALGAPVPAQAVLTEPNLSPARVLPPAREARTAGRALFFHAVLSREAVSKNLAGQSYFLNLPRSCGRGRPKQNT